MFSKVTEKNVCNDSPPPPLSQASYVCTEIHLTYRGLNAFKFSETETFNIYIFFVPKCDVIDINKEKFPAMTINVMCFLCYS